MEKLVGQAGFFLSPHTWNTSYWVCIHPRINNCTNTVKNVNSLCGEGFLGNVGGWERHRGELSRIWVSREGNILKTEAEDKGGSQLSHFVHMVP